MKYYTCGSSANSKSMHLVSDHSGGHDMSQVIRRNTLSHLSSLRPAAAAVALPPPPSQLPAFGVLFLAQKVHLVKSGLVKSRLVNRKEGRSVLVTEPNAIALVVDHPCRFLWWSNGVSGQPVGIFGGMNDSGVGGVNGRWHDWSLRHEFGRRLLGQRGVGNPTATANSAAAAAAAAAVTVLRPDDATVAETSPATVLNSVHQLWGQVLHGVLHVLFFSAPFD